MTRDLSRLLNPKSVAVIGGGAWCAAVIEQLDKSGFAGEILPVHPSRDTVAGHSAFDSIDALPFAPDASFVGVNRQATIETIAGLSGRNAGGAVCFASGFQEVEDGGDLNSQLLLAAGDMPILGPNCYGLINALSGAVIWPDQHGCLPCTSGVAIITQSSNIAINLTMQNRALPISHMVTCGNQAQTTQAEIASALLDDPRVTAIGLHVEGFGDVAAWQALARKARDKVVPLIAIKVGRSQEAQAATITHTASLAGRDAASSALLDRLGIARVDDLATFLETLKILHVTGALPSRDIATISCSGGEASLAADIAAPLGLRFPSLTASQRRGLHDALGDKVTLANPLDYHTYIWRDETAMTAAFSAMLEPHLAMTLLIVDFPRSDRCSAADWDCAVAAAKGAAARGLPIAMVATLPELMPEAVAQELMDAGIVPFSGLDAALRAVAAAQTQTASDLDIDLVSRYPGDGTAMSEVDAKVALARHGVAIPRHARGIDAAAELNAPLVLKGEGFAHKSEHGAVRLNLTHADLTQAAEDMSAPAYFVEEMVQGGIAELLIGVVHDPTCGFLMTIGAGGTLTELLSDAENLLLPTQRHSVYSALNRLKIADVLNGYRGNPAADIDAIVDAALAIQDYVLANADTVSEVEVNPLICTQSRAIAADALIRKAND